MTRTKMSVPLMLALATIPAYAAQDNTYHHEAEIGFLDSSGEADGLVNANYRYYFKAVELKMVFGGWSQPVKCR